MERRVGNNIICFLDKNMGYGLNRYVPKAEEEIDDFSLRRINRLTKMIEMKEECHWCTADGMVILSIEETEKLIKCFSCKAFPPINNQYKYCQLCENYIDFNNKTIQ